MPWTELMKRIGSGSDRPEEFPARVGQHLETIKAQWPSLDAEIGLNELVLRSSPPSIPDDSTERGSAA